MNIILCGRSKSQLESCPIHSHEHWEIIYCMSGTITYIIDGREIHTIEGQVMVIPPNTAHGCFGGENYSDLYIVAKSLNFSTFTVVQDYDSSIRTLATLIHKNLLDKEIEYATIADKLLDCISVYIRKNFSKTYKYDFVCKLKNTIYENFQDPDFSISEAVGKMGYNIDYIRRCFKDDLDENPHAYLTRLRMEQAQNLLVQENFVSVEDVSARCGYSDSYYFSRLFKEHFGVSPLKFRKANI